MGKICSKEDLVRDDSSSEKSASQQNREESTKLFGQK